MRLSFAEFRTGVAIMLVSVFLLVLGFFSMNYNDKKSILQNIFSTTFRFFMTGCVDDRGEPITYEELRASWFRHGSCDYFVNISFGNLIIFSIALFLCGVYVSATARGVGR